MAGSNANLPDGSELAQLQLGNDLPSYFFTIGLSGVLYTLRFRYNTRMARWIMDVADSQGNDLLLSIALLINRRLEGQFHYILGFPVGSFFVLDNANDGAQPTRYSFGTTHTAYYLDPLGVT